MAGNGNGICENADWARFSERALLIALFDWLQYPGQRSEIDAFLVSPFGNAIVSLGLEVVLDGETESLTGDNVVRLLRFNPGFRARIALAHRAWCRGGNHERRGYCR